MTSSVRGKRGTATLDGLSDFEQYYSEACKIREHEDRWEIKQDRPDRFVWPKFKSTLYRDCETNLVNEVWNKFQVEHETMKLNEFRDMTRHKYKQRKAELEAELEAERNEDEQFGAW